MFPPNQKFYDRRYKLSFYDKSGNLIVELSSENKSPYSLRLAFRIRQQAYIINQLAEFNIYNLSEDTQKLIIGSYRVVFMCGYAAEMGVIYSGNLMNFLTRRVQPDYLLTIFCLDYQEQYLPIWVNIPKTSTLADAIRLIVEKIPALQFNTKNLINLPTTTIGKDVVIDNLEYTQAFKKLADLFHVRVWVTNSQVYACPYILKSVPVGRETINLNYKTGMVGSPIYDVASSGVNVTSFFNSRLIPGNLVTIETLAPEVNVNNASYLKFNQNQLTRGSWMIFSATHSGDSRGQDWYSMIQSFSWQPLGKNVL